MLIQKPEQMYNICDAEIVQKRLKKRRIDLHYWLL